MNSPFPEGVIAQLDAAPLRRGFAFLVLVGLGALLIYLSVESLGGPFSRAILFLFGAIAFFVAIRLRAATRGILNFTEAGIEDGEGRILVAWADIKGVERGTFALKPSNGFTIRTKSPMTREWAPGLWWRLGKRFGVGGVSSAGAAKFMAEQIALRLDQET